MEKFAPIALFAYKKLEPLKATVSALSKNELAAQSKLFIFSDGPKTDKDLKEINKVRTYLQTITGFKEITIYNASMNKGLAQSIISGVSEILHSYGSAIVVEDDLISSRNFLDFMNAALSQYRKEKKVISISGYSVPIESPENYEFDIYFMQRASSWGWATWSDRWNEIDWSVSGYKNFIEDKELKKSFNRMGSDLTGMLTKQMNGKISSWAVRFCYHQFQNDLYTVFPLVSKISNIGFDETATHTKGAHGRYSTLLDKSDKKRFVFDSRPALNEFFVRQFVATYSLTTRAKYKLKSLLGI